MIGTQKEQKRDEKEQKQAKRRGKGAETGEKERKERSMGQRSMGRTRRKELRNPLQRGFFPKEEGNLCAEASRGEKAAQDLEGSNPLISSLLVKTLGYSPWERSLSDSFD